jgi:dUTP pyrophosphatase
MKVKIKLLRHEAKVPSYAHEGDAGLDIFSTIECRLAPGDSTLIPTGFSLELPKDTEAQIRPRSGLALNHQITVLNSPGTLDFGYRGEVGVILINHGKKSFTIEKGMKIAQMVVKPTINVEMVIDDSLDDTSRGSGGFGSTGN